MSELKESTDSPSLMRTTLKAIVVSAILGLLMGVAWIVLVPRPSIPLDHYSSALSLWIDPDNPELMAMRDSIFAVLGLVIGAIIAIVVFMRSARAGAGIRAFAWTLGGFVGSLVAFGLGVLVRPWNPQGNPAAGDFPLGLRAYAALLTWPLIIALILLVATVILTFLGRNDEMENPN